MVLLTAGNAKFRAGMSCTTLVDNSGTIGSSWTGLTGRRAWVGALHMCTECPGFPTNLANRSQSLQNLSKFPRISPDISQKTHGNLRILGGSKSRKSWESVNFRSLKISFYDARSTQKDWEILGIWEFWEAQGLENVGNLEFLRC